MMAHKTCTTCGVWKPITEYYKKPRGRYGRQAKCKVCVRPLAAARTARYRVRHPLPPEENQRRVAKSRWRRRPDVVQVRSEDELRMALHDPYPFYAEPRR